MVEVNGSLYRSGQWKPAYESIRQPESLTGKAPINDNLKAGVDAKGSKQNQQLDAEIQPEKQ